MQKRSKLKNTHIRKHDAYMHKFHLIDLLRMSKYTFAQKQAQNFENYKYTFNMTQFLYKNGLYIVIIMIFIALCIITPFVKNTQLFTTTNILNILQQASPRMFLALGVAGYGTVINSYIIIMCVYTFHNCICNDSRIFHGKI